MTEPVKFPGTDVEAPRKIVLSEVDDCSPACIVWCPDYEMVSDHEIPYLRADTVTPNALVEELVAAAKAAPVSIAANEHRKRLFDAIAAIEEHKAA